MNAPRMEPERIELDEPLTSITSELMAMRQIVYRNGRWLIACAAALAALPPALLPYPPSTYLLPAVRTVLFLFVLLAVLSARSVGRLRVVLVGFVCLVLGLLIYFFSPSWVPLAWGVHLAALGLFTIFFGAGIASLILVLSLVSGIGLAWNTTGMVPLAFDLVLTVNEIQWLAGWLLYTLIGAGLCLGLDSLVRDYSLRLARQGEFQNTQAKQVSQLEQIGSTHEAELSRRIDQIKTATEISRVIAGIRDEEELLWKIVTLVQDRFQLYYAGVFLVDERTEFALLKAGSGDAGSMMVREGHRLAVGGSSMIGWSIAMRKPRISFEVGQDAVRFANPHLPLTCSEMALPLLVHDQVLGALTIQSSKPNAFDQTDVSILTGIADNLAVALFNARLFKQIQTNLEEISHLHRQYLADAWLDTVEEEGVLSYTYQSENPVETDAQAQVQIPLTLRNQVIGRVVLGGERERFTPEELAFIDAVITQTALALENTRLLGKLRRQLHRERKVNEINSKLLIKPDIDEIIKTAAVELGHTLHVPDVRITLNVRP